MKYALFTIFVFLFLFGCSISTENNEKETLNNQINEGSQNIKDEISVSNDVVELEKYDINIITKKETLREEWINGNYYIYPEFNSKIKDSKNNEFKFLVYQFESYSVGTYFDYLKKSLKDWGSVVQVDIGDNLIVINPKNIEDYESMIYWVEDNRIGLIIIDDVSESEILNIIKNRKLFIEKVSFSDKILSKEFCKFQTGLDCIDFSYTDGYINLKIENNMGRTIIIKSYEFEDCANEDNIINKKIPNDQKLILNAKCDLKKGYHVLDLNLIYYFANSSEDFKKQITGSLRLEV